MGKGMIFMSDKVTIKIPRPLYLKLQKIIQGTGFNSVTEFIVYVLRDLVAENSKVGTDAEEELSREEIELIRRRLKNLGYL